MHEESYLADFREHGLEGTAIGDALEQREDEQREDLKKHREIVEAKVAVARAREAGVDDPAVEALAQSVEELSEETEAAALVKDHEKAEARERVEELEALSNTTEGKSAASSEQKAAALRQEHGLDTELMTGRYDSSCTVFGEIWTAKLNFAGGYA